MSKPDNAPELLRHTRNQDGICMTEIAHRGLAVFDSVDACPAAMVRVAPQAFGLASEAARLHGDDMVGRPRIRDERSVHQGAGHHGNQDTERCKAPPHRKAFIRSTINAS
jgi:hypothetical protein